MALVESIEDFQQVYLRSYILPSKIAQRESKKENISIIHHWNRLKDKVKKEKIKEFKKDLKDYISGVKKKFNQKISDEQLIELLIEELRKLSLSGEEGRDKRLSNILELLIRKRFNKAVERITKDKFPVLSLFIEVISD